MLDLESVHFLDQGTFYGFLTPTTSRSRIFDVPGLASFDPSYSNATSIAAGHVVLKQVDRRIALSQKEDAAAASSNTGKVDPVFSFPSCALLQLISHFYP